MVGKTTKAKRATAPPVSDEFVGLFNSYCLQKFPDDEALANQASSDRREALTEAQVKTFLHSDPGRGWVLAGAWITAMRNDSEAFLLWAIPTWEQWGEFEKAQYRDPALAKWKLRASDVAVDWDRFLLVDAPLCPFRTGRQPHESDRASYTLPDD